MTNAVVLEGPERLSLQDVPVNVPQSDELVIDVLYSAISTGTEKLFWTGEMPPFPGMGYPLVPGYEAMGEVVDVPRGSSLSVGDHVFVPGANCYGENVRGLFGAAARRLVTTEDRLVQVDAGSGPEGALLALAATARHAMAGFNNRLPDLIIGHGVLGRLLARLAIAAGGPAPTVWELDPVRSEGADGYEVLRPEDDPRNDYKSIYDASGQPDIINQIVGSLARGGEIVLAGFYAQPVNFAFPPAFLKEPRFRIAAEWTRADLLATRGLIETGALSLDGLITHERPASDAAAAYETAFNDQGCLKMVLNWGNIQ